jgi:hypothetical protein
MLQVSRPFVPVATPREPLAPDRVFRDDEEVPTAKRLLAIAALVTASAVATPAFAGEPTAADIESALQLYKDGKKLRETGDLPRRSRSSALRMPSSRRPSRPSSSGARTR